jgi:hypothetical protein
MRSSFWIKGLMLLCALLASDCPFKADTIYQTNPQGKQEILQRDAILVKEDSSILVYKHFDLQQRRVEKVQLSQRSLPYTVVTSSPQDRERIVALWKRFGYSATVTDTSGKVTKVFDAYLDFFPPAGQGSFFEAVPAVTSFPLQFSAGGADNVEFSKIAEVRIQNDKITLRLTDGRIEEGKFLIPTTQPAEARFLGITNAYNPSSQDVFDFSDLLSHLKDIRFEP